MACAHGLFTWRGPAIVPSLPMATEPRLFAKLSSPKVPSKAIYRQTRFHRKPRWGQLEVNNKRKVLWKHNTIRTNRANRPPPDSKAAKREIARDRNENASSASARSRAAEANPVAANKAAASKADDKADCLALASGGSRTPAACYAAEGFRRCLSTSCVTWKAIGAFFLSKGTSPYRCSGFS
jgi:hypothetical protein